MVWAVSDHSTRNGLAVTCGPRPDPNRPGTYGRVAFGSLVAFPRPMAHHSGALRTLRFAADSATLGPRSY